MKKYYRLPVKKLFSYLKNFNNYIIFESNKYDKDNKYSYIFKDPENILSFNKSDDISLFFKKIERSIKNNYIAGYFSYEFGYCFDSEIFNYSFPDKELAKLGIFKNVIIYDHINNKFSNDHELIFNQPDYQLSATELSDIKIMIDKQKYKKNIHKIKDYLTDGLTYQVNYTTQYKFKFNGAPFSLYNELRNKQEVSFAAFIKFEKDYIISLSPELFIRRNKNTITVKPMKGTIERGRDISEDETKIKYLKNDHKIRAEHSMIVDLIRNDIGKITEYGSVNVDEKFSVEKYNTLFQMTSTISGKLKKSVKWFDIFQALFPCGSVTGAPKISTMRIIKNLEDNQRGVYCGAIGFISPGNQACFNVPIRTIELSGQKGIFGTGGGIVIDSDPSSEYKETVLKAKFLLKPGVDFELLESILWKNDYYLLDLHLKRLQNSAQYFNFYYNQKEILQKLDQLKNELNAEQEYKIRILYSKNGLINIEKSKLNCINSDLIILSDSITDSFDPFYFHKTTHRPLYQKEHMIYTKRGFANVIYRNQKNEITEGSTSNIIISKNDKMYTPPVECGLLNGVYRQHLLKSGKLIEKKIKLSDLHSADQIYICNSVRKLMKVRLIPS